MRRMIYDGDSFYELDEECVRRKEQQKQEQLRKNGQQNPFAGHPVNAKQCKFAGNGSIHERQDCAAQKCKIEKRNFAVHSCKNEWRNR